MEIFQLRSGNWISDVIIDVTELEVELVSQISQNSMIMKSFLGQSFHNIGFGSDFLNLTSKTRAIRQKPQTYWNS